ncbi:MAG: rRNA maturation RNase YbeY [Pseudomonadota bacterium]
MAAAVTLSLEVQNASDTDSPLEEQLRAWVMETVGDTRGDVELVIRIVDAAESRELNRNYRHRDRPTNVLSFPFEAPPEVVSDLLGDLVICAPVVVREAAEQGKALEAHWAHMVVHGVLHLMGHEHQNDREAAAMEDRERKILSGLGFPDPYPIDEDE